LKLSHVKVHNFRSIKDAEFTLHNYSILVGANNAGKTSLLTALRIFYEDNVKFDEKNDFPKFPVDDQESWIEIEYLLTESESLTLKDEYRAPGNSLRVRKYFLSTDDDRVKAGQSNIFGYENGSLSKNLFYGAKNISQAKLGSAIYVPETAQTDETLKLSGPSPLRDMINFVVKKVVEKSPSFQNLNEAFQKLDEKFREEQSTDGLSLHTLFEDINENLKEWKVKFDFNINPLKPEEVVKNLISHTITDEALKKEINIKNTGQGLQRHLIFTLLQLSSDYVENKEYKKKEFSPDLTLLLFEEPEAFLHPCQQECLNRNLQKMASEETQQILASTHSAIFVSKNIGDMPSLVRLKKDSAITSIFQLSEEGKRTLFEQNNQLVEFLKSKLNDPSVEEQTKQIIRNSVSQSGDDLKRMEEESIRYLLWLDSTRCSAFFAEIVLVCEGSTEKTFIEYLIENEWNDLTNRRVCIMDAMGKYNVHRCMNLLKELGIAHSVLLDRDEDIRIQPFLNEFVQSQKNDLTKRIYFFEKDIETFLGIPPPERPDRKPLNVMWHYVKGKIPNGKMEELHTIVRDLLP
jgi:predicted ATP-dependent endonuclease of OLD family